MSSSLFSALSGLRASEQHLNVIGNNIANSSTIGYRSGRVTFGDLLSITTAQASAPSALLGGRNPTQVGLGVGVKSIDLNVNSGSILATNRNLDLAIFGAGFFVVNNGTQDLYTRAGTFGFDAQGTLVESGTGYRVMSSSGGSITVSPGTISPPSATQQIALGGNLPATVNGPLAQQLATNAPFTTGTSAQVLGTQTGPFAFTDGDAFTVEVDGGVPQTITFTAAAFTAVGSNIASATAADVAQVVNAQLAGATASASGGALAITSDTLGANSKIKISNFTGTPGATLGLSTTLQKGTQTAALGTTNLNDLVANVTDYVNGDGIEIEGLNGTGDEFAATFVYGTDGTTLEDLRAFVQNLLPEATVTLGNDGSLQIASNTPGPSQMSVTLADGAGNTGASNFTSHALVTTQAGTGPDTVTTGITVYDVNGEDHVLNLTFERVDADTWRVVASLPDADGTMLDAEVGNVSFGSDGSLISAGGAGDQDLNLEINFGGGTQTIQLDFGTLGGIDGVTQFGGPATAQANSQDGFGAGTLTDVIVSGDGSVNGVFSNGETQVFGTIAVANFANPGGMLREANNMFSATANSGIPQVGVGGGPGGFIQAGVLENSNVDLAEEFVRMIEVQRGYQANARVIRTSQDLLQGLLQTI